MNAAHNTTTFITIYPLIMISMPIMEQNGYQSETDCDQKKNHFDFNPVLTTVT